MARIRSIHPEFFTDDAVMEMTPWCQLMLIGIWTQCDDAGVFEWKPVVIKARVLPAADVKIADLMAEAVAAKAIERFDVNGIAYGVVRNFCRFQKPKKPTVKYPRTEAMEKLAGYAPPPVGNQFPTDYEPVGDEWRTGDRPVPTGEEGRGGEKEVKAKSNQRSSAEAARAKEAFKVDPADPALLIIEAFDQARVDAFGPEHRRPFPKGNDIVYARRWHAAGYQPPDLYQFFVARQQARARAGKDPIDSLAFLEQAVAEIGGSAPAASPGAAPANVVRFLSPDQELRARKDWWIRDRDAAKARGEAAPPIKGYGLWYDAHNGQEIRLMGGERPPIPPAPPREAAG